MVGPIPREIAEEHRLAARAPCSCEARPSASLEGARVPALEALDASAHHRAAVRRARGTPRGRSNQRKGRAQARERQHRQIPRRQRRSDFGNVQRAPGTAGARTPVPAGMAASGWQRAGAARNQIRGAARSARCSRDQELRADGAQASADAQTQRSPKV